MLFVNRILMLSKKSIWVTCGQVNIVHKLRLRNDETSQLQVKVISRESLIHLWSRKAEDISALQGIIIIHIGCRIFENSTGSGHIYACCLFPLPSRHENHSDSTCRVHRHLGANLPSFTRCFYTTTGTLRPSVKMRPTISNLEHSDVLLYQRSQN